ncbi:hypothetical protein BDR07DRAFT_1477316 [Suillus spraguei]|nr:hypothetical protein BDR07DRAFT_1477316 [Suillus spraguei]
MDQCPDYTSAVFQTCCTALLCAQVQWQLQVDVDALAAAEQQCLLDEEAEQCAAAQCNVYRMDAAVAAKDQKKNCIHHIAIPNHPCPTCAAEVILVADFALHKLDKAQFESMVPTTAADGSTPWISANGAHPVVGVMADHLLTPLDFSCAVPHFIHSLSQRGWKNSCIVMLANFFGVLMLHDYWTSDNVLEQHALVTYEEEQRCAWHQAIPLPDEAWNIDILKKKEPSRTFNKLYHAERDHANLEFDAKRLQSWQYALLFMDTASFCGNKGKHSMEQ